MVEQFKKTGNIGRIADRPQWCTYLSLVARAVHQIGAAVFLAIFLLDPVDHKVPLFYLVLTVASGFLLMGVEAIRHRQLLREISGLTTMVKLVIFGLAFHAWIPAVPAVLLAFFLTSIVSHAPKAFRHRLLL